MCCSVDKSALVVFTLQLAWASAEFKTKALIRYGTGPASPQQAPLRIPTDMQWNRQIETATDTMCPAQLTIMIAQC